MLWPRHVVMPRAAAWHAAPVDEQDDTSSDDKTNCRIRPTRAPPIGYHFWLRNAERTFGKQASLWYDTGMLWVISDLHLSSVQPKPMDIFGARWKNHADRIAAAWQACVQPEDTVLVAGDISWALKIDDAIPDLAWIDRLPGRKVLSKGNHDYWWERAGPLRKRLPSTIAVVEADAVDLGDVVVCGTRGWLTPGMTGFDESSDRKIYNRELGRLDRALATGRKLAGTRPLVVMFHYPPFVDRKPTEFARRITTSGAAACVYGHLHRPSDWAVAVQGQVEGVHYQLTACDYLDCKPVPVRGLTPV